MEGRDKAETQSILLRTRKKTTRMVLEGDGVVLSLVNYQKREFLVG